MDNLFFWLALIFIAWLLEAVGSARRRARARQQEQPAKRPAAPGRTGTARGPVRSRPALEEIERQPVRTEGQGAAPTREPGPWVFERPPPPPEEVPLREAVSLEVEASIVSLETLEPAGEASHARFHKRYLAPEAAPPAAPPRVWRPYLTPGSARQAVVWSEVLGRPLALRDRL